MGYTGPALGVVYDFAASSERLCRDLADEGGSKMTDHTKGLTPVGHRPFQEGYIPGHLLESIEQKLVVVTFDVMRGVLAYESGAMTNVDYAPYVEHGTGLWGPARAKYEIRPKNPLGWLRFHDKFGNEVFAKRVLHPGSPGAHMFEYGAAETELSFHEWADAKVAEWARKTELEISVRAKSSLVHS